MEKVLQANHEKTQLVISNHETTMYPPKGQNKWQRKPKSRHIVEYSKEANSPYFFKKREKPTILWRKEREVVIHRCTKLCRKLFTPPTKIIKEANETDKEKIEKSDTELFSLRWNIRNCPPEESNLETSVTQQHFFQVINFFCLYQKSWATEE